MVRRPGGPFIVELTPLGQQYIFPNGGPDFPFDAQVSLYVLCDSRSEVDRYWEALPADGGAPQPCGWLSDRFGLTGADGCRTGSASAGR